MRQLLVSKEETLPEHQEWNLNVDQQNIKEEENLWIGQQGEKLQQLEEADLTTFGFTAVTVKIENDDDDYEKPETLQLHQSQSDESTEPVANSSSVYRTRITKMEGEDNGEPPPAIFSGLNSDLQPGTNGRSSNSSKTETSDSYDYKEIRELQPRFNCQKNSSIDSSSNCNMTDKKCNWSKYRKACGNMNNSEQHKGRQASLKSFNCPNGGKSRKQQVTLNTHTRIQREKKPFGCSECGKLFKQKSDLMKHTIIHTGQKTFGCTACDKRFVLKSNLTKHMVIHTFTQNIWSKDQSGDSYENSYRT
ncbi:zinc finger protein interacting with ribonucleoprotein K-like [Thalassophryne amazonica]|uniref:zinc finger protein interacting with ribonucleoprotein K-like n=1 Tax=Thalassophryne amazonica TaxID=390379 RepID=UPI001470D0E7|nr:zinc finger protein interacting with ribonucleoprotein K-like [Thalassophryne amazonica]